MALKGLNEITHDLINNIHDVLPDIDTKEGTFIRDVFINPSANEISALYYEIRAIQLSQSVLTASGEELDDLASNYFIDRKPATRSYGTVRFYIKFPVRKEIVIPQGTKVTTLATTTNPEREFETTESILIPIGYNIMDPSNPTQAFIDVLAWSTFTGSDANASAMEITQIQDSVDANVVGVVNVLPFSGGTDNESDVSLAVRINLAVSGANIGTKDGYTAFILKQEEVIDARVVGAGEPLMKRDEGKGGMVDIYVRSNKLDEHLQIFNVDNKYVTEQIDTRAYEDIILQKQPVERMISLVGKKYNSNGQEIESKMYHDGSEYLIERGTNKYFSDTLWLFEDVIEESTDANELLQFKAINILNNLLSSMNYLNNIYYELNWSLIIPERDTTPEGFEGYDQFFMKGIYEDDNKIYQVRTKPHENPYVSGRYFIKKDGSIYERSYYQPDFIVKKDISEYGYSHISKDAIHWLPTGVKKPDSGEVLEIKYNYTSILGELQNRVDGKRVLTADVLVKQARKVGLEIYAEVVPYASFNSDEVMLSVINRVTSYINNIKKLGGNVSVSDIAYVIRGTNGVDDLDLYTLKLARTNGPKSPVIEATEYEYLEVDRVSVFMYPPGYFNYRG